MNGVRISRTFRTEPDHIDSLGMFDQGAQIGHLAFISRRFDSPELL